MNLKETAMIYEILQMNYPDTDRGMSKEELKKKISLWQTMFADEPYPVVHDAVKAYMVSSTERFMPNIGQIKEQIRKMTTAPGLSEQQAWNLVHLALRNSTYGYKEEYAKLPPSVQTAVGSAEQLQAWAAMDADTVQSVVASNFMRSFKVVAKRDEEFAKLPEGMRSDLMAVHAANMPKLEAGQTENLSEMAFERTRQEKLRQLNEADDSLKTARNWMDIAKIAAERAKGKEDADA